MANREIDYRKSTIVSVCPYKIHEVKHTIYPNEYIIPKASQPDGVQCLEVANARGYIYLDAERGSLRVVIASEDIAKAVVNDYIKSCLQVAEGAHPGIGFLTGNYTEAEVIKEKPEFVKNLRTKQETWFKRLVTLADDDWNKFHQHKMISDLQRLAATSLGIEREWITVVPDESRTCPMCRNTVHPMTIICGNCKYVINQTEYEKHKTRFVE